MDNSLITGIASGPLVVPRHRDDQVDQRRYAGPIFVCPGRTIHGAKCSYTRGVDARSRIARHLLSHLRGQFVCKACDKVMINPSKWVSNSFYGFVCLKINNSTQ